MISNNYTLEEFFDYKNFSSGFIRKLEECIEISMNTKILFVDIDGTLTETISGHAFKQNSEDVKVIKGVQQAIAHFHKNNWLIIGVSNQGGIAKGFKTLEATIREMQVTLSLIPYLSDIYFCPDFEGKECWRVIRFESYEISDREMQLIGQYRKPDAGMLKLAKLFIEDGNREVTDVIMVGDRSEDMECASAMGCKFMWAENWRKQYGGG
jgi:D-glycero-D-manno-heptose 1,7-bisphosphate phosphatase